MINILKDIRNIVEDKKGIELQEGEKERFEDLFNKANKIIGLLNKIETAEQHKEITNLIKDIERKKIKIVKKIDLNIRFKSMFLDKSAVFAVNLEQKGEKCER